MKIDRIREELSRANTDSQLDSLNWLRKFIIKNIRTMNPREAFLLGERTLQPKPGFIYTFNYDPKYKETLPYYDKFPLIMCLDVTKNGFYGINLHYIDPKIRASIFANMLEYINNEKMDDRTKFKLTWAKLKTFAKSRYLKHSIKQYLTSHLGTPLFKIPAKDWNIVAFLPIARFEKASEREVWKDI